MCCAKGAASVLRLTLLLELAPSALRTVRDRVRRILVGQVYAPPLAPVDPAATALDAAKRYDKHMRVELRSHLQPSSADA
jgi:hypothetical protein